MRASLMHLPRCSLPHLPSPSTFLPYVTIRQQNARALRRWRLPYKHAILTQTPAIINSNLRSFDRHQKHQYKVPKSPSTFTPDFVEPTQMPELRTRGIERLTNNRANNMPVHPAEETTSGSTSPFLQAPCHHLTHPSPLHPSNPHTPLSPSPVLDPR